MFCTGCPTAEGWGFDCAAVLEWLVIAATIAAAGHNKQNPRTTSGCGPFNFGVWMRMTITSRPGGNVVRA